MFLILSHTSEEGRRYFVGSYDKREGMENIFNVLNSYDNLRQAARLVRYLNGGESEPIDWIEDEKDVEPENISNTDELPF